MGPDFKEDFVLWFKKINVPDLGKESPVIIDVNNKELHCGYYREASLTWWSCLLAGDSCDCLSLQEAWLMVLNDDSKQSPTHRTALRQMNNFP